MMKFKYLFRRKASPTGNEGNSTLRPSASSLSYSSSSSSIPTQSTSPLPFSDENDGFRESAHGTRNRSSTDPSCIDEPNYHPVAPTRSRHEAKQAEPVIPIAAVNPLVVEKVPAEDGVELRQEAIVDNKSLSQSNSESEASLTCLQDRIMQMEETHHSTHEELQATIQELADLQAHLTEVEAQNCHLNDEKAALQAVLERKDQEIHESQELVQNLRQRLLVQENKSEEEKDVILAKQTELEEMLAAQQDEAAEKERHISWLQGKVRNLETQLQEEDTKLHLEINRLLEEIEKERNEKDSALSSITALQEARTTSQKELALTKEKIVALQEEVDANKEKAKDQIGDLEQKIEKLLETKKKLEEENEALRANIAELDVACLRHLEFKCEMRKAATEQQQRLAEALAKREEAEHLLAEERAKWTLLTEEWQQFQKDLLTTVRVADEFKMNALAEKNRVLAENKELKDQNFTLQTELDRYQSSTLRPRVMRSLSSVESLCPIESKPRGIASRLESNRLSVKRLVENLEVSQSKQKTPEETPVALVRPRSESTTVSPSLRRTESDSTFSRTGSRSSLPDPLYSPKSVMKPARKPSDSCLSGLDPIPQERKDPLASLVKNGGSKRNALLKWCQSRTAGYANVDITNFSSSWNDGLALCALLHNYLPHAIPFKNLNASDVRRNFEIAFRAAEAVGVATTLDINELTSTDRPDWQSIMTYITAIYKHFEP